MSAYSDQDRDREQDCLGRFYQAGQLDYLDEQKRAGQLAPPLMDPNVRRWNSLLEWLHFELGKLSDAPRGPDPLGRTFVDGLRDAWRQTLQEMEVS